MHSPKLILSASVPLALSSGTLFVYSVYGTQLAERCGLSSLEAANLNISATVGSAIGGIIGGLITDIYGTRAPLAVSMALVVGGYKWLHLLSLTGLNAPDFAIILAMFFVGLGATAGYFGAIKAVTVAFPDHKGTAQSITIALFAILSLIFSQIHAHVLSGNLEHFLLFLSVLSLFLQAPGVFFINIGGHEEPTPGGEPLIPFEETPHACFHHLELSECLCHPIFWAHFAVVAVFQGLGQMYIYCVGYILQAVHTFYGPDTGLGKYQALHVLAVALALFAGRLSLGPVLDQLVKRHCQRHWVLCLAVVVMLLGHVILASPMTSWCSSMQSANAVLVAASLLVGYAYGLGFTTFPVIIADLFHMKNYLTLWGLVYSSTVAGLAFFTKLFGHVYDSNSRDHVCYKGSTCFRSAFVYTLMCSVLVLLVVLAVIRARRKPIY